MSSHMRTRPLLYSAAVGISILIIPLASDASIFAGNAGAVGQRQAPAQVKALPAWAIGPFARYTGNPIMRAPVVPDASTSWEWPRTYNPGVVERGGIFHMLYRGATLTDSAIGAASSTDGLHFTPVSVSPAIPNALPNEAQGAEDPRLYYLDGKYYTFFTGYSGGTSIDINEAISGDAVHWKQLGPVIMGTRDAAVIASPDSTPVKIGGEYLMYYGQTGSVDVAASSDMIHWSTVAAVNLHFPQRYDPYEVCVAVTAYRTTVAGPVQPNIDLFVAGQLMGRGRWFYAISEVEMSRAHPSQELARLPDAVLAPHAPYEIYGSTPHTVFMNTILFHANRWWMYYGAGDSVVALANAPLRRGIAVPRKGVS